MQTNIALRALFALLTVNSPTEKRKRKLEKFPNEILLGACLREKAITKVSWKVRNKFYIKNLIFPTKNLKNS